jgi:hypothetical protein
MDPVVTLAGVTDFYGLTDLPPSPVDIKGVTRATLPFLMASLGFTEGAEIGVWRGEFSQSFCQANSALHLTGVDAWTPYPDYTSYRRPDKFHTAEADARQRLASFNCTLLKGFSLDVARTIPDASLDFVYIDANHTFDACIQDLIVWSAKVKPGGIVSGHDYFAPKRTWGFRVIEAVNAYTLAHDIDPWFLLGRRKRRLGEAGEKERSWLWVKT